MRPIIELSVTVVKGFWRKISTFFTFSRNNGIYSTLHPLYQHIVHKNLFCGRDSDPDGRTIWSVTRAACGGIRPRRRPCNIARPRHLVQNRQVQWTCLLIYWRGTALFLYIVLDFHRHSGKHLLGAIAQDLAQDLERTVTSAVPGIDFLDIQFAQALRKGPHHFVLVAEQVEPAEKRVDFFCRGRSPRFPLRYCPRRRDCSCS